MDSTTYSDCAYCSKAPTARFGFGQVNSGSSFTCPGSCLGTGPWSWPLAVTESSSPGNLNPFLVFWINFENCVRHVLLQLISGSWGSFEVM